MAARVKGLTLTDAQRRAEVVRLRTQRWTFDMIGTELGISGQRAGQLYRAALAAIPGRNVDEHRAEAAEQADAAIRDLLSIAKDSRAGLRNRIDAWHCIRSWEERRAKLLGLDAPTRSEIMSISSLDAEIAKLELELEGRSTNE